MMDILEQFPVSKKGEQYRAALRIPDGTFTEQGFGRNETEAVLALITDLASRGRQQGAQPEQEWYLLAIGEAVEAYKLRHGGKLEGVTLTVGQAQEVLSWLYGALGEQEDGPQGLMDSIALIEKLLNGIAVPDTFELSLPNAELVLAALTQQGVPEEGRERTLVEDLTDWINRQQEEATDD